MRRLAPAAAILAGGLLVFGCLAQSSRTSETGAPRPADVVSGGRAGDAVDEPDAAPNPERGSDGRPLPGRPAESRRARRHVQRPPLVCICGEHRSQPEDDDAAPTGDDARAGDPWAVMGRGLDWLALHQSADGRWSAWNFEERCGSDRCGGAVAGVDDAETTGLALLAFVGAGEMHNSGEYKVHVKRGARFLRERAADDGWLATDTNDVRAHATATLALTELYGMTGSKLFRPIAESSLAALLAARGEHGWPRTRGGDSADVEATVWTALALKSALMAEVPAAAGAPESVLAALHGFGAPGDHAGLERAALCFGRVLLEGVQPRDVPEIATAVDAFPRRFHGSESSTDPGGDDERSPCDLRTLWFETSATFQLSAGYAEWRAWARAVVPGLTGLACTGEGRGTDGSWWDAGSPAEGRVRATAFAVTTVPIFSRYHRVFREE